jgi:hypothetical protein
LLFTIQHNNHSKIPLWKFDLSHWRSLFPIIKQGDLNTVQSKQNKTKVACHLRNVFQLLVYQKTNPPSIRKW